MINPLIPMLAITGRPTKNEITDIVDRYAHCGFDQLMLYPRDGCELSYLTDEWFEALENFINAGKRHNMSFWLYDEYNYPSGGCKGRVMAEGFCLKYIKANLAGGVYVPKLMTNEKYPDILNPDAMDFFIDSTHIKYEERFKKYFGREIRGIFTDEPSFYYGVWEDDELPFYDGMPGDYFTLTGRSFYEDYDAFYSNRGAYEFIKDCYKLLSDRMYMSFTKRIGDWCERNNLYMTGHLMNDALPVNSVRSNGNVLKQLSGFSLPAVDDIFSDSLSVSLLSTFSVIQYASFGKDGAGAELFALGPCDMSFSKMRMMLWYATLFGVNHYFLAIAHLDVRGNAYRKYYFNDFSPDNPCSFAYRELGEEAKKAAYYAKREYNPEVYVRFPGELASYELFGDKKTDRRFGELLSVLKKNQIQYMLINDETDLSKPVIEITENGFSSAGTAYDDVHKLIGNFKKENLYTLPDGSLSDEMMVRSYADGTDVILNLTDRAMILNSASGRVINLEPYEVRITSEPDREYRCLFCGDVKNIVFKDSNIAAATFDETGVYEFAADEDIEVIIAKREYPDNIEILLDDVPVNACDNSVCLPEGFNKLYRQTGRILLKKGDHRLSVKGGIRVFYKYLPEILLSGDFYTFGNVLGKKNDPGSNISRYGKLTAVFVAELPRDKKPVIALEGTDKPVALYADGKLTGIRTGYPYVWELPEEYQGKTVRFTLESASDLSCIFGDTSAIEKLDGTPSWCAGFVPAYRKEMSDIRYKILEIIQ